MRPRPQSHGRGPIEADALYPLSVFLRRLGIGRHSLTALRRRGLPLRSIGQRLFIDGREALDMLRRLWEQDEAGEKQEGDQAAAGDGGPSA
jgi:hypothetical protein